MRVTPSTTRTLLTVGLMSAVLGLAGCAKSTPATGSAGLSGQSAPATAAGPSTGPAATPRATQTKSTAATHTATHAPGPTIKSFVIAQEPKCAIVGTTDAPFSRPATPLILKWSVGGSATGAALSLDDKGFFKKYGSGTIGNYPASNKIELQFSCDTSQAYTTHEYSLNTIGGGPSVQKTLTVREQTKP